MKRVIKWISTLFVFVLTILSLTLELPAIAEEVTDESYYNSITATSGDALLKELNTLVSTDTVRKTYTEAWECYKTTDVMPGTNIVWDIYSNTTYECGDKNFQGANISGEGSSYNREHAVCQSWIKTDATYIDGDKNTNSTKNPMYSDLFHLYPVDGYSNTQRNNNFFGEVTGEATYTSTNGSKLGPGDTTFTFTEAGKEKSTNVVFEIADEYKGDIARSYFYILTRYNSVIGTLSAGAECMFTNSYPYLTKYAYNLFIKWNYEDPVSQKEIDRNEAIFAIQKNRNPYIDHPEYVEMVFGAVEASSGYTYKKDYTQFEDKYSVAELESKITALTTKTFTYDTKGEIYDVYRDYLNTSLDNQKLVSNSSTLISQVKAANAIEKENPGRVTYVFKSKDEKYVVGDAPKESTYTYTYTGSNYNQVTAGKTMTLTLFGYEKKTITGLYLEMKSNSKSGAGYIEVKAGSTVIGGFGSASSPMTFEDMTGAYNGNLAYVTIPVTQTTLMAGEKLVITITGTENSLYCNRYSIDYSDPTKLDEFLASGTKTSLVFDYKEYYSETTTTDYRLITNENYLFVGSQIIIAAKDFDKAIGTKQDGNFKGVDITKSDNATNVADGVLVITLEEGCKEGTYALKTSEGYLACTSTSNNYLKTLTKIKEETSWTIKIKEDGTARITSVYDPLKTIMYNSASNTEAFSSYKGTQKDVVIYKKDVTNINFEYSNVKMRFGTYFDVELQDYLESVGEEIIYGVELSTDGGENYSKYHEFTPVLVANPGDSLSDNTGSYLQFAYVIPVDEENYATIVTARCYVIIDGVKHVMNERAFSVNSLVKYYQDNASDLGIDKFFLKDWNK